MRRASRIQQIYGYAVCLVAIVAMLISVPNLFEAVLAHQNPIQAGAQRFADEPSLNSFEAYQATYQARMERPGVEQQGTARDTLTTAALRQRFEVLRADRIARVLFETDQRMAINGLVLVLGVLLFATHWRWLSHLPPDEERASAA